MNEEEEKKKYKKEDKKEKDNTATPPVPDDSFGWRKIDARKCELRDMRLKAYCLFRGMGSLGGRGNESLEPQFPQISFHGRDGNWARIVLYDKNE